MLPSMRVVGRGSAWRYVEDAHGEGWGTVLSCNHLTELHAIGQSFVLAWRDIVIGFDYHPSPSTRLSREIFCHSVHAKDVSFHVERVSLVSRKASLPAFMAASTSVCLFVMKVLLRSMTSSSAVRTSLPALIKSCSFFFA